MNRITKTFEALRQAGRKGLVGYLTAGDPDFSTSEKIILKAIENGLDILELGVPFSDPTADGPEIQAAAMRALSAGMTVAKALDLCRRLRKQTDIPIVLFGYANPLFIYGYEKVCRDAVESGVDAFLVVDLPFEETGELRGHADRSGLCLIPLIAPTTPDERAAALLKDAQGFVYYIMVRGVTGARSAIADDLAPRLTALRRVTALPIAVGFGVSNGEQARQAAAQADAVVVGSALVRAAWQGNVVDLVRDLRAGLDSTARPGVI
jgi:tryptophan synthase alpha chain